MTRPLTPEEVGALALGLASHRPDDETWAVTARMLACGQADYLSGAGLEIVPSAERERHAMLREVASAAVEWAEAHDALSLGDPNGPPDDQLLERYSTASIELIAVVSQNRDALRAALGADR